MLQKVLDYVERHTDNPSPVLTELERQTQLQFLNPRMCSGAYQGQVLQMLSKMLAPKYILEIGTFSGYSALCLAKGLQEGGKLVSLDINDEIGHFVNSYAEKAGLSEQIELQFGHALELIPKLPYDFDLVFIDADKENYLNYFTVCIEILKPGAFMLVDNVLWDYKVLDPNKHKDVQTQAISEFNKLVVEDKRVEVVMLPIRDGLTILRVK